MRYIAHTFARSFTLMSCALTMVLMLGACGNEGSETASGATTSTKPPQVSSLDPCELTTPDALKKATGRTFREGKKRGPQCYFSTTDYALSVSVSTGLDTVADHLDTKQITVGGAKAVQGASPEDDQCLVDVALGPEAPTDVLSTSVSGATTADKPCDMATSIAEKTLPNVEG